MSYCIPCGHVTKEKTGMMKEKGMRGRVRMGRGRRGRVRRGQKELRLYLGTVVIGWALKAGALTAKASLALFSSFSNILFIPPSRKYSWQMLGGKNKVTCYYLMHNC